MIQPQMDHMAQLDWWRNCRGTNTLQDSKTAALNRDIFLLEVLMGIILPRQVHSKASYTHKKWSRDSLEMAVNYMPRPCVVWVRARRTW